MKTIKDIVREHAKAIKGGCSTNDGLKFLELSDITENNIGAANLYLEALKIINHLEENLTQALNTGIICGQLEK